jgi:predicted GH43/DUF377 family glycosyl hydrolase
MYGRSSRTHSQPPTHSPHPHTHPTLPLTHPPAHLYKYHHDDDAGTAGWVPKGSYEGGFVILDKDDPTLIVQRSGAHPFVPVKDYEIGDGSE